MKKATLLVVAAMACSGLSLSAQRDNRTMENGVVTVVVNDSTGRAAEVEKAMKENAPTTPHDNGLPRFAIIGKERQFYIGIGAQFLGEGVMDWGDNMPSAINFIPSSITPSSPGNRSNLRFAWQTSSVYMNVLAMPHTNNQVGLFFKTDFTASSLNVSHFYAKYRGLTAGFTNSAFTDGAAEPMTIDNQGPNGYPSLTLFTAYWTQQFTNHLSGAIGIDAPNISLSQGAKTASVNQRIPTIPLYLQYGWDDGSGHIRLSGIVRTIQYRDIVKGENETMVGGGVQLSGMSKLTDKLSVQWNGAYGCGIGTYIQGDNGLGLDASESTTAGKLEMMKTMGVTGGLNYCFSSKVSSNLVYSHVTNWLGDNGKINGDQYRYGDYVAANVLYNINKFVAAGIEYDYGHRKSFDGTSEHTNRIQCQLSVTF